MTAALLTLADSRLPTPGGPRVHLSPHEQERLLLSYAAELARRRRARGLRLILPEATAVVTDHVLEGARDRVPTPPG